MTTSTTDAMDSVLFRLHAVLKALTAPGATTKSDGGEQPNATTIAAIEELKRGGGEIGTGYGEYTPVTVRGSTSDPSSTRSDVTVDDEPPENTTVGGITWHSSEEDSGPDVGISVYLGPDDRLWCGEISRRLFEEHDGPARFDSDLGAFIVRYAGKETTLIAKCADMDTGREFVEQIAEWVRKSALLDQFEIRRK